MEDIESKQLRNIFKDMITTSQEIWEEIEDEIVYFLNELEIEGVDYFKFSKIDFYNEFHKRSDMIHVKHGDIYYEIFKKLTTDPNQLELKLESFKSIYEYYAGPSKGQIIWKYLDIEEIIEELISWGVPKYDIQKEIVNIIKKLDQPEKIDLTYVTEKRKPNSK